MVYSLEVVLTTLLSFKKDFTWSTNDMGNVVVDISRVLISIFYICLVGPIIRLLEYD